MFGSLLIIAFLMYCLLDVALSDAAGVRNFPKLIWLLLVVLLPVIGGVVWLVAGRPTDSGPQPGGQILQGRPTGRDPWPRGRRGRPSRPPTRPTPRGPDDDPEFLRGIDERLRRRDDDQ